MLHKPAPNDAVGTLREVCTLCCSGWGLLLSRPAPHHAAVNILRPLVSEACILGSYSRKAIGEHCWGDRAWGSSVLVCPGRSGGSFCKDIC